MMLRSVAALLIGALVSSAASAQTQDGSYYEQPLEGVYSQGWWVENITLTSHKFYSADIKGEGKIGDFSGSLNVRCGRKITWTWTAIDQDLFVNESSVPKEALVALSAYVCRNQ